MSESDKLSAKIDQAKGQAKETVGKITNNEDLQAEGKFDKVKGQAEEAVENIKGAVKDLFNK